METGLTKNKILSELSRSPHGKLTEYIPVGQVAAQQEPEFLAHLIAWDKVNGQVRDAKVAIPIVSLSVPTYPDEFVENSLAHLGLLSPRELLKSYRFALSFPSTTKQVRLPGRMRKVTKVISAYLKEREEDKRNFDRVAIQHRHTLKELYALCHIKPNARANAILFKGEKPAGSVFEAVSLLGSMSPTEAAGTILERKIPFLIAMGALGKKAKEADLVLALINRMSPTELVTNTKMLEKLGIKTNPALRGAYESALQKAASSKQGSFKATRAIEAMEDETIKEKLRGLQEKQIEHLGNVEGNWLVLGDKSGSMVYALELARRVASTLSKMVKGKIWLVFFDTHPTALDVTGKSLDEILKMTKYVTANGGTSIGCGLNYLLERKEEIDGIAIISDGGENNSPYFPDVYKRYAEWSGKYVPVYLYHCEGDNPALIKTMNTAGIDMQVFDMKKQKVDYYSLPNLIKTMRTNRYSLVDEVMQSKLLKLEDVFKSTHMEVFGVSA